MTTSLHWQLLHKYDTKYSADSIEWCPHYPNVFVCGTYQLKENESTTNAQKRVGQILLFSISTNGETLKCIQEIDTDAVLDQKWCSYKINDYSLLAIANAIGEIQIFKLDDTLRLQLITTSKIDEETEGLLSLSLDLSTEKCGTESLSIIVSDSKGFVSLFKLDNEKLTKVSHWKAHDYEAWICALDYWNTNIFYSGGDDCKLKGFDLRVGSKPFSVNSVHSAGVTSMQTNLKQEHTFISGSYDETILTWDVRNLRSCKGSIKVSGGVWRLKWDPFEYENVIAACMYGAFHIINFVNLDQPRIVANYHEHSSICYGSDWSHLNHSSSSRFVATCSFYDQLLTLSKINLNDTN